MVRPSQAADVRTAQAIARLSTHVKYKAVDNYRARLETVEQVILAQLALGGRGQGGHRKTEAVNRAALVMLTGQFQGFVQDLFVEAWNAGHSVNADPEALLQAGRFQNPWPAAIDDLFELISVTMITKRNEPRSSALGTKPRSRTITVPVFARAQRRHQVRQVVAEMVAIRNRIVHGNAGISLRLRDVTVYLSDTVYLAVGMAEQL